MLTYHELKEVKIDQRNGKFVGEGIEPSPTLPVVVLAEYRGQVLDRSFGWVLDAASASERVTCLSLKSHGYRVNLKRTFTTACGNRL